MEYFNKLFEAIDYIAARHKKTFDTVLDEKVKEAVLNNGKENEIYIRFNRHQLPDGKKSDYEYLYFNAPIIINEMRFDIDSLAYELQLPQPEYCNGWGDDPNDVGGFLIRIPDDWNKKFKYKEYNDRSESIFWWQDWKCSDEHLIERYKHFNEVIKRYVN